MSESSYETEIMYLMHCVVSGETCFNVSGCVYVS